MADSGLVSVVIATRNRPAQLRECLSALTHCANLAGAGVEAVVVDDGSREPLDGVVAPHRAALRIALIRQDNLGPGAARNAGVQRAQGELIAFTDDDCRPAPDWLSHMVAAYGDAIGAGRPVLVGGHTRNALPKNVYSSASQALIDYLYAYYNRPGQDARFFTSNNMLFGREPFLEVGGFDPQFRLAAGEDRDLAARCRERGWRLVYAPRATIDHAHHLDLRSFLRQHLAYGRGAARYHSLLAAQRRAPVRVEPFAFYANLVAHPIARRGASGWSAATAMVLAALMAGTQIANALGFALERARMGRVRERRP